MKDHDIRDSMVDLAESARPAYGLAETALRRARTRHRTTRIAVAGGSAFAVAVGAVGAFGGLPSLGGGSGKAGGELGGTVQPAISSKAGNHKAKAKKSNEGDDLCLTKEGPSRTGGTPGPGPGTPKVGGKPSSGAEDCDVDQAPGQKPEPIDLSPLPHRASNVVALWVSGDAWYVADRASGALRQSPWSWVSASPDGDKLAVLEKSRASRIGIVDRDSGKVEKWIDTEDGLSSVFWSPKGDRLLATAFEKPGNGGDPEEDEYDRQRKGFVIADPAKGTAQPLVPLKDDAPEPVDYLTEDLVFWTGDGAGVVSGYVDKGDSREGVRIIGLDGRNMKSVPDTGRISPADGIATSPDNRYVVTEPDKTKNRVVDVATGKAVERTRSFSPEAWLGKDRFIGDLAWEETTTELAIVKTDGTVVDRLWKAPKEISVHGIAMSR